jgi:hypothetical protein
MNAFGDERDQARPVVLVLSDGKDTRATSASASDTSARARSSIGPRRDDVMLYAIGMRRTRGARAIQPGSEPGGLQAALTADLPILDSRWSRSRQAVATRRFASDRISVLHSPTSPTSCTASTFSGSLPPKRDGKVHDIDVRVAARGLKPRARKATSRPKINRVEALHPQRR